MDRLKMQTENKADANFRKLAELFPDVVTETIDENGEVVRAIDKDALLQEISAKVVDGRDERYLFTWPGKRKAILAANAPSTNTLRPCREDSVNFDTTENLYIEGDNLEVLKLLQENYLGRVKMIYIDPPYNTGNDFVYNDSFAESMDVYMHNSGQYDDQGNQLVQNTEANGRFHTDWLNMMYPRLKAARNLLSEDGAVFISIDDNEVDNLRKICDEIFGEKNFVGEVTVVNNPKGRNDSKHFATCNEYAIVYGKEQYVTKGLPLTEDKIALFNQIDENGNKYQLRDLRKRGNADSRADRPNMYYPIYYNEVEKKVSLSYQEGWIEIFPIKGDGTDGRWRWGKDRAEKYASLLMPKKVKGKDRWGVEYKIYLDSSLNPLVDEDEEITSKPKTIWDDSLISSDIARRTLKSIMNANIFDFPKSVELIKRMLQISTDKDSIVLDFFSGSATTAHAVLELNNEDGGTRKFIMVQLPEETPISSAAYKNGYKNICQIGKERIRRAGEIIANSSPSSLDVGFRVLKLDSSNMQQVWYTPNEYVAKDLFETTVDNVKSDRSAEDLLFQAMLELDCPLSSKIETMIIKGKTLYNIADGYLMACFEEGITDEIISEIAKKQPYYFVMRDCSLANDSVAVNFEQIFKSYSPDTILKVF